MQKVKGHAMYKVSQKTHFPNCRFAKRNSENDFLDTLFLFALFSPANFKPAKDKGPLGQAAHSHCADTEAEYEELEKSRECQRCGEAMRRLFHFLGKGV